MMSPSSGVNERKSIGIYVLMLMVFIYIGRIQELYPFLLGMNLGKISFGILAFLLLASRHDYRCPLKNVPQVRYVFWIFVMALVSVPFSAWPRGSMDFVTDSFVKTGLFFILIVMMVNSIGDLKKIVWAIIGSVLFLSIVAASAGEEGRVSASSTYDPNDLAFVLVTFMPLAYFFMKHSHAVAKWFIGLVMVAMLLAILATVSRGGLVGLLVITVAIIFKEMRNVKKLLMLVLAFAILFSIVAPDTYWVRMSTMLNPEADYNTFDSTGRLQVWKRGLKMIFTRPLNGHGINVFEVVEGSYHGGVGKWSSPHNSFIQIGAELGVIGLALFIKLLWSAIRVVREFHKSEEQSPVPSWLCNGIEVSLYGYIVTGFFLSQAYSPILFILIALVTVIQRIGPSEERIIVAQ